jgi:predicted nucleic acid-binding protein
MRMPRRLPQLPACRDAKYQMLLTVAAVGEAGCPVSGDREVLALRPQRLARNPKLRNFTAPLPAANNAGRRLARSSTVLA